VSFYLGHVIPVRTRQRPAVATNRAVYLGAAHPLVGEPCPACTHPFAGGDAVAMVVVGPGDDADAQEACREGRHYAAACVAVHVGCAGAALPSTEEAQA
jgi:hypothetical protein